MKVHFKLYVPDCRKMVDLVERYFSYTVIIRAVELSCNSNKSLAKSKHIDIKFLVIKKNVWNHIVFVDSVNTILNITDLLTKGRSLKVFLEHITHMRIVSHNDILV